MGEPIATDKRILRHIVVGHDELRPDFKAYVDKLMQARSQRAKVLAPSESFAEKTANAGMVAVMYPGASKGLELSGLLLDHVSFTGDSFLSDALKALGIVVLGEATGLAGAMVLGRKGGKLLGRGVSAAARGVSSPKKLYVALRNVSRVHKSMNAFISENGFKGMVENPERRGIDFNKLNHTHFAFLDGEGNLHFAQDNGTRKAASFIRRVVRPLAPEGKAFRYLSYR